MIPVSVSELAEVVGAAVAGPGDGRDLVTSVVADSRLVTPGALFVALPGTRVDGRDFVSAAAQRGAVAALTGSALSGARCLVVPDPLAALGTVARHVADRARSAGLAIVGITGSAGKTSTKDLLAQILEAVGPTVAPVGNLNNELGLPLTVTRVDPDTRFLVAEMGARGVGHIAYLCRLAPPDVALVLNVGHAHVGEFGSQAAIARAKSELVLALQPDGTAVLNADDPHVWAMRSRTRAAVLAFSDRREPPHSPAVWASGVALDDLGRPRFRLHARATSSIPVATADVALRLTGRHQVANAVAAAAAALAVGVGVESSARALTRAAARSRWRMELTERADGLVVVNDSYNANPESMQAALDALALLTRGRGSARSWALLGDMLELGADAEAEHTALGAYAARSGVHRLVAVGTYAAAVVAGALAQGRLCPSTAVAVPDKAAMAGAVLAELRPSDVVLVKASRGLALETVADEILTTSTGHGPARGALAEP